MIVSFVARMEERSGRTPVWVLGILLVVVYMLSVLPYFLFPFAPRAFPSTTYVSQGKEVSREEFIDSSPNRATRKKLRQMLAKSDRASLAARPSFGRVWSYLFIHGAWLVFCLIAAVITAEVTRHRFGRTPIRPLLLAIIAGFVVGGVVVGVSRALARSPQSGTLDYHNLPSIIVILSTGVATSLMKCWEKRFLLGHCKKCRYVLRGLPTPVCPECGTGFDPVVVEEFFDANPDQSE